MIINLWSEVFDNERLAMWIKFHERTGDDAVRQIEKYSRQLPVPPLGLTDLEQLALIVEEVADLGRTLVQQGEARKYVGRHEDYVRSVLELRPFEVRRPAEGTQLVIPFSSTGTLPDDPANPSPRTASRAAARAKPSSRRTPA